MEFFPSSRTQTAVCNAIRRDRDPGNIGAVAVDRQVDRCPKAATWGPAGRLGDEVEVIYSRPDSRHRAVRGHGHLCRGRIRAIGGNVYGWTEFSSGRGVTAWMTPLIVPAARYITVVVPSGRTGWEAALASFGEMSTGNPECHRADGSPPGRLSAADARTHTTVVVPSGAVRNFGSPGFSG